MTCDPGLYSTTSLGTLVTIRSGRLNSSDAVSDGAYPFFTCGQEVLRIDRYEHDREVVLLGGNNANGIFPVFYYNGRFTARQRVYIIWSNDPNVVSNRYLYYALKWLAPTFTPEALGTTTKFITLPMLQGLEVPLPPIETQLAITTVLSMIDDRLSLLQAQNKTLEAIAQALFKSWFVDFEPVHAKLSGFEPNAMDPKTTALFPSTFSATPLGMIPQGWFESTVGKSFEITMGQSPPSDTYNQSGDGLPFYQGRADFGFRFPGIRVFCNSPTRIARAGDTLVSVRAPVGDINRAIERCCIGRGLAAVRREQALSFTYYSMWNLASQFALFENEGTVFGSINQKQFSALPFILPPQELISTFESLVAPLDDKIENNEVQIRSLIAIRESLLPQLVSGKLRIPDAEKALEEAL